MRRCNRCVVSVANRGFKAVPGVKLADGSSYRMIAFAVEIISLKPLQLVNLHEQQLLQGMSSLPASVCRTNRPGAGSA